MAKSPNSVPSSTEMSCWQLTDRAGELTVNLDPNTGLAVALRADLGNGVSTYLPLRLTASLDTEGAEVDGQPWGLAYVDTVLLTDFVAISEPVHTLAGYDEIYSVETRVGDWGATWRYRFRGSSPRLEISVDLSPVGADGLPATIRDLHLTLDFAPNDLADWRIHAPGAPIRPGLPASDITTNEISEPTFRGSGIMVLDNEVSDTSLLVWSFSRTEGAHNRLQEIDGGVRLDVTTQLAGRIVPGEHLDYSGIQLDILPGTWDRLRPIAHTWLTTLGISAPADTASWIPGVSIFEVQIGTSVFWNGYSYSPYPTMRDLLNDLGRIAGLGFDCIQIMPRQPFPSYNVYDYADITTSYGDEDDLKQLVAAAHALGMHVILDILMHGVIDADIIHRTADRVRQGPYFPRLNEGTEILPDPEFTVYDGQDYLVSWSRHIIDFESYWAGGSPGSHPLVDEHPEWFIRRSDGQVVGVYTKAFDLSNRSWQEYFTDAALHLMRELDVDGFRFDAPTYNEFPNWSKATEKRASSQQLGAVEYFGRLRPEMKSLKPDAMLYTEPSGTLFRQTMDITYNYDEHWLIHSVLRPEKALKKNPAGVRHARDLAAWMRDKEAVLPQGSITARHIDSHDTFWWPLPGFKWRREQYGLPATRALLATWTLIGGAYMSFIGGETDIEEDVRRVNRLRHQYPVIRYGSTDYDAVSASDDHIFATTRVFNGSLTLVLVNLSNDARTSDIAVKRARTESVGDRLKAIDLWGDQALDRDGDFSWDPGILESFSLEFDPYQIYVLAIEPAS